MGFLDYFKNGRNGDKFDPLADLTLDKLRVGFMLDYDLKTWEVRRQYKIDLGDGLQADEWELVSAGERVYLERTEDDEVLFVLSKKMPIAKIEEDVKAHIQKHDDPQEEITVDGKSFYLEESGPARQYEKGKGLPGEFVYWEFIDEEEEELIVIEQWGETDFECFRGQYVEPYQFSNILPGQDTLPE